MLTSKCHFLRKSIETFHLQNIKQCLTNSENEYNSDLLLCYFFMYKKYAIIFFYFHQNMLMQKLMLP